MEKHRRYIFPQTGRAYRPLSYTAGGNDVNTGGRGANTAAANPYAGGYKDGGVYGDMLFGVTGVTPPQPLNKETGFGGYLNKLGEAESRGSGDYQAKNKYGFLGRYQMGAAALVEAGFYNYGEGENSRVNKYNGAWTEKAKAYGITSAEDFLNNPEAQEAAIREYNKKNWQYIKNGGYDKYIGKEVNGTKITASGLLAVCHLLGPGGVGQLFGEEGPYDIDENGVPVDGNKTPATTYLDKMKGLDLTELLGYNPDKN